MSAERLSIDGYPTLRVRTLGSGPTLLMLHGFASGLDGWPEARIDHLAGRRRLVLVDLPGHGGSDPVGEGGWQPDRIVSGLVELLEVLTGRPEADWLGYSMGGRLTLHAARMGAPVRRLLLESATPGLRSEAERAERRAWDAEWARRFASEPLATVLDDWLAQPIFATRAGLSAQERSRQLAVRRGADGASLARVLLEFGTGSFPPVWDQLADWGDRTSLLVGAADQKYVNVAGEMADAAPEIDVQVVPGIGHAPHIEAPDAWGRWIERRLDIDASRGRRADGGPSTSAFDIPS